jgi:hypothetical protein
LVTTAGLQIPTRLPLGQQFLYVAGGENLFNLAAIYLKDPSQWWRIAALNGFPGMPPDFIVIPSNVIRFPILLLPEVNLNATPLS